MEVLPLGCGNEMTLQFVGVDEDCITLKAQLLKQVKLEEKKEETPFEQITLGSAAQYHWHAVRQLHNNIVVLHKKTT